MANSVTPFGLRVVKKIDSGVFNSGIMQFSVAASDATSIFPGDPVKLAGTSQIINGLILNDVVKAATGDIFVGVVDSVLPNTRDSLIYRNASTQRILLVNIDPNAEFEVRQVTGGTPLTANDIGLNANLSMATAGNTFTGISGVALNNVGAATTATLDVKITGMPSRPDNDPGTVGTGADASIFYVRINRHQFANQIAGA